MVIMFAGSEQEAEYELEEVWDGAHWHVIHKMVPKKTDAGINHKLTIFQSVLKIKHIVLYCVNF